MSKKVKEVKEVKENTDDLSQEEIEKRIDLTKKALNKKYGDIMQNFDENSVVPTVSTGCISLDLALGNGGMAFGRIYEVYGQPGGGKTTLALSALIQVQKRGFRGVYLDAEHAIDPVLMRNYGVDLSMVDFIQGYDGESSIDALEQLLKTGFYRVAVIDSISALIPHDEAEATISQNFIGNHAKLVSKAAKRLTPIANENNVLIILINQLRCKITTWGSSEEGTGGKALPYFCCGRIGIKGGEAKDRRIEDPVTGSVVGHKTIFTIAKNKLSAPYKEASANLMYGKGFDAYSEVLSLALGLGVIDRSGSWYKYMDSNFAQGEQRALEFLKDEANSDMYNEIRDKILDQTGLRELYEAHNNE